MHREDFGKTFFNKVVNDGFFKVHGKELNFDKKSLFLFHYYNQFRQAVVWFCEWKWFERAIITIILLNAVLLACIDYEDRNNQTRRNQIIGQVDICFTVIFAIEALLKVIEMGFIFHRSSYLRDPWNWLDFIVVLIGIINILPGVQQKSNFKSIRTFRVLRPLRSINAIPSMKNLISALIKSLPDLVNVVLFLLFIFLIFGILGVQLFGDAFYNRCRLTEKPLNMNEPNIYWPINYNVNQLCQDTCDGLVQPGEVNVCGNPKTFKIPLNNENIVNDQLIFYGIPTFDNIGVGMLTVFQILTMESWTDLMYKCMDSLSDTVSVVYYCSLVIFGAFFLLQLILAAIMESFEKTHRQIDNKKLKLQKNVQDMKTKKTDKNEIEQDYPKTKRQTSSHEIVAQIHEEEEEQIKEDDSNSLIYEASNSISEKDEENKDDGPQNQNQNQQQQQQLQIHLQTQNSQKSIEEPRDIPSNQQDMSIEKIQNPNIENNQNMNSSRNLLNQEDYETRRGINDQQQRDQNLVIMSPISNNDRNEFQRTGDFFFQNRNFENTQIGPNFQPDYGLQFNKIENDNKNDMSQSQKQDDNHLKGMPQKEEVIENLKKSNQNLFNENEEKLDSPFNTQQSKGEKKLSKFRVFFYNLCINSIFNAFMTFLIVINTAVLAMDRYPIPQNEEIVLDRLNSALTWCFFIEMMIKIIGLGFKGFIIDKSSIFDALIVILSMIEDILDYSIDGSKLSTRGAISSFRAFRLLKIIKLVKSWKSFQDIIKRVGMSVKDIINFSILLFLFIYISALLGMELFANKAKFDLQGNIALDSDPYASSPRCNFDNIVTALTTIFVLILCEAWNFVMYSYVRVTGMGSCFFFVSIMIIGHYILLSLFMAILLQNFENELVIENDHASLLNASKQTSSQMLTSKSQTLRIPQEKANTSFHSKVFSKIVSFYKRKDTIKENDNQRQQQISQIKLIKTSNDGTPSSNSQQHNNTRKSQFQKHHILEFVNQLKKNNTFRAQKHMEGKSFFIMSATNPFRIFIARIVSHPIFENFILFIIFCSAIHLAIENPLDDPNGEKSNILNIADYVFTILFAMEFLFKVISFGFLFNGKNSYLRNAWNILDFAIVSISIISLVFQDINLSVIKSLRILRILRPLRMISKNRGLKIAVLSLFNSIPGTLNVLLILLFMFLLFGILGVTFFKGKLFSCNTDAMKQLLTYDQQNQINTKWDCLNYGGEWINNDQNFDNIINAMVTLFTMSTTEGWVDQLWAGVDVPDEIDYQPQRDNHLAYIIYFVLFIIFGALFLINLFVGVVISTFNNEKDRLGKNHFLTQSQKQYIQVQLLSFKYKPVVVIRLTGNKLRDLCIKIHNSKAFELFIMILIVLNTAVLALKYYNQPDSLPMINDIINYIFSSIFAIEAIIKIIALRKTYFYDGWNIFDFFIVILTFVVLIIERAMAKKSIIGPQTTVLRAFRIFRLFRLVRSTKKLKVIFNTLLVTIPSLANVGGLLFLLLFLYSILGNYIYAEVMLQNTLISHANFQSFGISLLTLFRMSTGENWNGIMWDAARKYNILFQCQDNPSYDDYKNNGYVTVGCGGSSAFVYFISFEIIIVFIFLNLFIAIILEGFDNSKQEIDLPISEPDIVLFSDVWKDFDPDGTGFIVIKDIDQLLKNLIERDSYLIYTKKVLKNNDKARNNFIANLRIPTYHSFSHFNFYDILIALAKYKCMVMFQQEKIVSQKVKIKEKKEIKLKKIADLIKQEDNKHDNNQINNEEIEELDDYEEVIQQISELSNKIDLIGQVKNQRGKIYKSLVKHIDFKSDTIFDSSHVIYVPIIQQVVKRFLEAKKKKLAIVTNEESNISQNNPDLRKCSTFATTEQQSEIPQLTVSEMQDQKDVIKSLSSLQSAINTSQIQQNKKLQRFYHSTEQNILKQELSRIDEEEEVQMVAAPIRQNFQIAPIFLETIDEQKNPNLESIISLNSLNQSEYLMQSIGTRKALNTASTEKAYNDIFYQRPTIDFFKTNTLEDEDENQEKDNEPRLQIFEQIQDEEAIIEDSSMSKSLKKSVESKERKPLKLPHLKYKKDINKSTSIMEGIKEEEFEEFYDQIK